MTHKLGIIGAGYVGTACEICFSAMRDCSVLIYDKYKPSSSLDTVVAGSDILFVCVPTPMQEDGSCDTSIVEEAVHSIAKKTRTQKAIVIKSTIPPGTTMGLQQEHPRHEFVFNPEFLTEANFIEDFSSQEFIILGGQSKKVLGFYQDFARHQVSVGRPNPRIEQCSTILAEMVKYSVNSFLATKVTFFNEIKEIADQSQVAYEQLRNLILLDKRVGASHTLVPGTDGYHGFGGKCLSKDINGLISYARSKQCDPILLESVWAKNLMIRECYDWESIPGAVTKKTG